MYHYAPKIPRALAEAQYGRPCKHSHKVFYLRSFFFFHYYLVKTGDKKDSIYNRLSRSSDPYTHLKGLLPLRITLPEDGRRRRATGGPKQLFEDRTLYFERVLCLVSSVPDPEHVK